MDMRKILKKAQKVNGTQERFVAFIQENIIDQNLEELLNNEDFIAKLEEINIKFKYAIENYFTIEKKDKDVDLIDYFKDDKGKVIISEDEMEKIPKSKPECYKYAKEIEKKGDFETAKRLYKYIVDQGENITIEKFVKRYNELLDSKNRGFYYAAKYSYYFAKVKNGERLTDEEMDELDELLKSDKDNILALLDEGHGVSIEFLRRTFGEEVTIEQVETELLPNIRKREKDGKSKNGDSGEKSNTEPKIMSAQKRIDLYKSLGEIHTITIGKKEFDGYLFFTFDNLTIAEKFFESSKREGMIEPIPQKQGATYFIHKDAKLDLKIKSKSELFQEYKEYKDKKRGEKLVDKRNHGEDDPYKNRVKEAFEYMNSIEIDKETGGVTKSGEKQEINKTRSGKPKRKIEEQQELEVIEREQENQFVDLDNKDTTEEKEKEENLEEIEENEIQEIENQREINKLLDEIAEIDKKIEEHSKLCENLEKIKERINGEVGEKRKSINELLKQNTSKIEIRKVINEQTRLLTKMKIELSKIKKQQEEAKRFMEEILQKRKEDLINKVNELM